MTWLHDAGETSSWTLSKDTTPATNTKPSPTLLVRSVFESPEEQKRLNWVEGAGQHVSSLSMHEAETSTTFSNQQSSHFTKLSGTKKLRSASSHVSSPNQENETINGGFGFAGMPSPDGTRTTSAIRLPRTSPVGTNAVSPHFSGNFDSLLNAVEYMMEGESSATSPSLSLATSEEQSLMIELNNSTPMVEDHRHQQKTHVQALYSTLESPVPGTLTPWTSPLVPRSQSCHKQVSQTTASHTSSQEKKRHSVPSFSELASVKRPRNHRLSRASKKNVSERQSLYSKTSKNLGEVHSQKQVLLQSSTLEDSSTRGKAETTTASPPSEIQLLTSPAPLASNLVESNPVVEKAIRLAREMLQHPNIVIANNLWVSVALPSNNTLESSFAKKKWKRGAIPAGFVWSDYPPLDQILQKRMEDYYKISQYHNQSKLQTEFYDELVEAIRAHATKIGCKFKKDTFSDMDLRMRIRAYYKTKLQNAKKRLQTMLQNPNKKSSRKQLCELLPILQKLHSQQASAPSTLTQTPRTREERAQRRGQHR